MPFSWVIVKFKGDARFAWQRNKEFSNYERGHFEAGWATDELEIKGRLIQGDTIHLRLWTTYLTSADQIEVAGEGGMGKKEDPPKSP